MTIVKRLHYIYNLYNRSIRFCVLVASQHTYNFNDIVDVRLCLYFAQFEASTGDKKTAFVSSTLKFKTHVIL